MAEAKTAVPRRLQGTSSPLTVQEVAVVEVPLASTVALERAVTRVPVVDAASIVGISNIGTSVVVAVNSGSAKVGASNVGTENVEPAVVERSIIGRGKLGATRVGRSKVERAKVGRAKVGRSKVGRAKVGISKVIAPSSQGTASPLRVHDEVVVVTPLMVVLVLLDVLVVSVLWAAAIPGTPTEIAQAIAAAQKSLLFFMDFSFL